MRGKPIIVIALVIALGAGLVVTGTDVLPGNDDGAADPFPTETAAPSAQETTQVASGSGGETATPTATPTPPFGFTIENIEECGQTCRDVTSTLTNQQDTTAEDVVVYTRIFAGQGTDGDVVWRGDAGVGTLGPGQSYTTTRRVELGFQDALAVQNADGWITVQTTVETADQTVTFTDERQVA
ncbi:hypothetical protein D3D02_07840 [Halobellus sp. Atlit-38R]|jgi:hypothetical protein|uniref:hypothetical protein n=1 Tax=Halobellus sp. Atlit-38R TaxID=2282131 RepID=UPI000EF1849E|nr:hypothetical protein [Halobellus sp. Atlit-38R]RLM89766.1 hypothetical protein D3D02_07840 [Halobellus sp. Atlit-38R]